MNSEIVPVDYSVGTGTAILPSAPSSVDPSTVPLLTFPTRYGRAKFKSHVRRRFSASPALFGVSGHRRRGFTKNRG